MKTLFSVLAVLLLTSFAAQAQRRQKATANDTPSVVMVPEYARQIPDSAAFKTGTRSKRRRKFGVAVVPAPPPGRTRQEILYSDSLAKQPLGR